MQTDRLRFSHWSSTAAEAPAEPGVVQIKVERLVTYPNGKSAMVWYGAGDDVSAVAADALSALRERFDEPLLVRWRLADAPQAALESILGRFVRRFGAPPRGQ